jgi:succinate dehydrogenase / fumarate reductase cytochrome b subunit
MAKARPKHLNLFQIRQPVPAVVSILHRISGAGLFLFLWAFLAALERSLASADSLAELQAMMRHPLAKLLTLGLIWATLHHTFAGIRHLGLDLRLGIDLPKARATAWAVLVLSLGLTIVLGAALW